jgi:xylulokinase
MSRPAGRRVLVAGVDSSTQACKVVIRDAHTGELIRAGRAPHPDGTEVDPVAWSRALDAAAADAGGLADVDALSVAAQQHGMVCLDADGAVVRPALLWNDTRSAADAADLVDELGDGDSDRGSRAWADAVGSRPVASFTVTKLRWLAAHEPASMDRAVAVCLPHDWLTWRLGAARDIAALRTDRGDASGTGYWSPAADAYRLDLLRRACGKDLVVPAVLGPAESAGTSAGTSAAPAGSGLARTSAGSGRSAGIELGAGTGDNAAAALGVGAGPGDVVVSVGTSGTVFGVAGAPTADPTGIIAGFADATGRFLPLVCTLNAARVLSAAATMLGVSVEALTALALSAAPGAGGIAMVPYLDGERTPNRPTATGSLHGLTVANASPANLARAAVEGMLCGLADGLDALREAGITVRRVLLIGGGARSEAVRTIAPAIFGVPVAVPEPGEYVADGAARQAAWMLSGEVEPPSWTPAGLVTYDADPRPDIRLRYATVRDLDV